MGVLRVGGSCRFSFSSGLERGCRLLSRSLDRGDSTRFIPPRDGPCLSGTAVAWRYQPQPRLDTMPLELTRLRALEMPGQLAMVTFQVFLKKRKLTFTKACSEPVSALRLRSALRDQLGEQ